VLADIATDFAVAELAEAAEAEAEPVSDVAVEPSVVEPPVVEVTALEPRLDGLLDQARQLFARTVENMRATGIGREHLVAKTDFDVEALRNSLLAAAHVPAMQTGVLADWPATTRKFLPMIGPDWAMQQAWGPVLAWLLLRTMPSEGTSPELFDQLMMRTALAESFGGIGIPGEDVWRAAARVRILIAFPGSGAETIASDAFWAEPDVRWLTGANEADGETWFNQEQFEEMVGWLQVPSLIAGEATEVETTCAKAAAAAYNLKLFLELSRAKVGVEG